MKKLLLLVLALFVSNVQATVIMDFEGVAPASTQLAVGNNYSEDGFNLYNPGATDDAAIIGQPTQNTSGSDYYTWNSPSNNNPVVLTELTGASFDFFSLDVGAKNSATSLATFDITGFLSGGGTVVSNVVNASAFSSLVLGWTNLTKVEFSYVSGNFGAIDNLSLNTVPAPATLALMGLGLAGIGFARKKKTA